ncbi:alpha/beta hydrolase family protein [Tupanvirus deep ocean]|uniref:Alpha/beta hydrolase family protein n=2 Tax=Tupanvirus TaxID=2094720 RepID=A0AC62A8A1_9VIRU|nr:alpha/beta hydrolase family protein [Tupanvirus deep ocean]QKU34004.1 alpha/beta hydrolase family protein [Tupanvirus deep ocean]
MGLSLSSLTSPCSSIDENIEKMIYYPPSRNADDYSRILNTSRSKLLILKTKDDKKVSAVQIRPHYNTHPEKYIVFSHGNGCDIISMFNYCQELSDSLNVGVMLYDYIGYGISENEHPTEQGCYDSIDIVINYLTTIWGMDKKKIFLVGQSLGTGITVDYISKNDWETPVILISPYKSICRVVADTSCITPVDKFKSQKKLKNVKCPIKIFHGTIDEVISISHGIDMYNSLKNKSLDPVWFEDTGHNNIIEKITKEHYLEVLNFQF